MESIWGLEPSSNSVNQLVVARIVIGVTGHRTLVSSSILIDAIQIAFEKVRKMLPPLRNTPVVLSILSPIAEGADRLVAWEGIKSPGSTLEIVLPLEKEDYKQDFETAQSKAEFEELLSKANTVKTLPIKGNRNDAYEKVGHYVVDQCDVLLAIWNGQLSAGKGGTQEIVQYALDNHSPLIWINSDEPESIKVEPGHGLNPRPFLEIDKYNSERFHNSNFEKQLKKMCQFLSGVAERTKLPFENLQPISEYVLRYYIRADILSLRYQHLHYRTESLVYVLALIAVFVATFQILFLPQQPMILIAEIVLMLIILLIFLIKRQRAWHNKWMDYRFLAERFRSALFMALADIDISTLRPPRHLSLAYSPKDWMVSAFISVWSQRPRRKILASSQVEELKCFISKAWIEDQIRYHASSRIQYYRWHHILGIVSNVLYTLTICAVLLHITIIGSDLIGHFLAFSAVVFPAVAASISAIRTHRDYLRNSMRSAEMAHHLKEIKSKMIIAKDYNNFVELMNETEETMLYENEDWRVAVKFKMPEIHL